MLVTLEGPEWRHIAKKEEGVMRLLGIVSLLSLAVGSVLASGVYGDEARRASTATVARATDMIGLRVYNSRNEDLGKIENFAIDPSSGKIRYAVLSFGGLLGMGDKLFAVPWSSLSLVTKGSTSENTQKEEHYVLDVSKEALKNAPGFDNRSWPDFADSNWTTKIDQFYGVRKAERGSTTR